SPQTTTRLIAPLPVALIFALAADEKPRQREGVVLVPFGVDSAGGLVAPANATAGALYKCPGCDGPLQLHRGSMKVIHFHHGPASGCTAETIAHKTAKRLVCEAVRAGKASMAVRCRECGFEKQRPIPAMGATEELPFGPYRLDVGLTAGDRLRAAVELKATHDADPAKLAALNADDVPWVELDAFEVVA